MTILLYSGNFGLGHELDTVLRAVHTLNGDTNLRVLLVGNGKGLAETRRLAEELAMPNIEFRPPVPLYGLPELLASGDIHLVSQKPGTEGLIVPSKIYGTLAVGRPVIFIGPEHCEAARIVHDSRCGFVIAPGDMDAAAQALRQLALDADLRMAMGQRARRYYVEKFGRQRSVARIIDVIEHAGGNGESNHPTDKRGVGRMTREEPSHRSVMAATMVASILMLIFGVVYHAIAARLEGPAVATSIPSDFLKGLPLQMGDWTGEDIVMDEALVRATDSDAYVNRRYWRKGGLESVQVFIGCNLGRLDLVWHRPEVCYAASGWTLVDDHFVGLSLDDGTKVPCTLFRFSRGELETEEAMVLHYYIVDGQPYGSISVITQRVWHLRRDITYVARVLIAASNTGRADDSAEKIVADFARDFAPSITHLFETLVAEGQAVDFRNGSEGK